MSILEERLKSILDSVENAVKSRKQKIEAVEEKRKNFWQNTAGPALSDLTEAIRRSSDRAVIYEPPKPYDNEATLVVKTGGGDEWQREFSFSLSISREDLSLFVSFGADDKKYPPEEISKNAIYDIFFDRYETALLEKLVPN